MSEYSFLFLAFGFVFLLLVQLNILGVLRNVRSLIENKLDSLQKEKQGFEISQHEQEKVHQARRVKYRLSTSLRMELTILGKSFEATIGDISESGLMFECKTCSGITIGDSYPANIYFSETEKISSNVLIFRNLQTNSFGASFDNLSIEDKKLIRSFVSQGAKKELSSEITESKS